MSGNQMDNPSAFNRVSLRAVLVSPGDDPGRALAEAGIVDPLSLPVVFGEDPRPPSCILGDGVTPNLVAVLETETGEMRHASPETAGSAPDDAPRSGSVTAMLPAAFGAQPLAPIPKSGV